MRFLFIFTFLFLYDFGLSQTVLFSDTKFIEIESTDGPKFVYHHKLKAKETIYSLSRIFNQSVEDIFTLNRKSSDYIFQVDEIVKVSFDPTIMTTNPTEWTVSEEKVAVLYQVKSKENLYRISREYFPQSMDHLMSNNKMQSFNLSVDQKLTIGYILLNQSSDIVLPKEKIAYIQYQRKKLKSIDKLFRLPLYLNNPSSLHLDSEIIIDSLTIKMLEEEKSKFETIVENGIALWDKKISDKENLFVLHKSIKPGSQIEVYYPLLQKSVAAQVVGNIPKGLYAKDVDLIISPKVAEKLSVRDAKFRVTVKYLKELII